MIFPIAAPCFCLDKFPCLTRSNKDDKSFKLTALYIGDYNPRLCITFQSFDVKTGELSITVPSFFIAPTKSFKNSIKFINDALKSTKLFTKAGEDKEKPVSSNDQKFEAPGRELVLILLLNSFPFKLFLDLLTFNIHLIINLFSLMYNWTFIIHFIYRPYKII